MTQTSRSGPADGATSDWVSVFCEQCGRQQRMPAEGATSGAAGARAGGTGAAGGEGIDVCQGCGSLLCADCWARGDDHCVACGAARTRAAAPDPVADVVATDVAAADGQDAPAQPPASTARARKRRAASTTPAPTPARTRSERAGGGTRKNGQTRKQRPQPQTSTNAAKAAAAPAETLEATAPAVAAVEPPPAAHDEPPDVEAPRVPDPPNVDRSPTPSPSTSLPAIPPPAPVLDTRGEPRPVQQRRRAGPATAVGIFVVGIALLAGGGLAFAGLQRVLPSGGVSGALATPGASAVAPVGAAPGRSPGSPAPAASSAPSGSSGPAGQVGPASVAVVERTVLPWKDVFGEVRAQVVVTVENRGSAAVRLPSSRTRYTIADRSGKSVAAGRFAYAFPQVVPPGGRATLVDTISASFVDPKSLVTVEPTVVAEPAAASDAGLGDTLQVTDLAVARSASGGLAVSGHVANHGSTPVTNGIVGVVLRDRAGHVIGSVYDLTDVARLAPGEERDFTTDYPGTPPANPSAVATISGTFVDYRP